MRGLVTRLKSVVMRSSSSQGSDWSKEVPSDVRLARGLLRLLAERQNESEKENKDAGTSTV